LVEIDKVATQGYYGCEESMNINHSWVAIKQHKALALHKLREWTIFDFFKHPFFLPNVHHSFWEFEKDFNIDD
jgi:hypothetical protein